MLSNVHIKNNFEQTHGKLEQVPIIELFVKKNNIKLQQSYNKNYCLDPKGAFSAIRFTFEHNFKGVASNKNLKHIVLNYLLCVTDLKCSMCSYKILSFFHYVGEGRVSRETEAIKLRLSKACYVLQQINAKCYSH